MNLYIQVDEDGAIIGHPITEENLLQAYLVKEIDDEFLSEHSLIRFERKFVPIGHEVLGGEGYEINENGIATDKLITKVLSQEEKVDLWIRRPRNHALAITDWTQLPDAQLSDTLKAEFATFRQTLRDMTDTYANIQDPAEVVWPTMPGETK